MWRVVYKRLHVNVVTVRMEKKMSWGVIFHAMKYKSVRKCSLQFIPLRNATGWSVSTEQCPLQAPRCERVDAREPASDDPYRH